MSRHILPHAHKSHVPTVRVEWWDRAEYCASCETELSDDICVIGDADYCEDCGEAKLLDALEGLFETLADVLAGAFDAANVERRAA